MFTLIEDLRSHAEWAEKNIWEVTNSLPDDLRKAATALEQLYQYFDELQRTLTGRGKRE